jgi:hypothetical protein
VTSVDDFFHLTTRPKVDLTTRQSSWFMITSSKLSNLNRFMSRPIKVHTITRTFVTSVDDFFHLTTRPKVDLTTRQSSWFMITSSKLSNFDRSTSRPIKVHNITRTFVTKCRQLLLPWTKSWFDHRTEFNLVGPILMSIQTFELEPINESEPNPCDQKLTRTPNTVGQGKSCHHDQTGCGVSWIGKTTRSADTTQSSSSSR